MVEPADIESPKILDPRNIPASQLGENRKRQFELADMPESYDDTKHGPPPMFIKYKGMAERIIEVLDEGGTQSDAATMVGISRDTLAQWLRKGRRAREALEAKGPLGLQSYWDAYYIAFLEMVEMNEAEYRMKLLKRIEDAGEDQWQPNAWILERRWPEDFSTRQTHRHEGHDGGPVQHKFTLDLGDRTDKIKAVSESSVEEGEFTVEDE